MEELPTLAQKIEIEVIKAKHELEIKQTEALAQIGTALSAISTFVTNGGLQAIVNGYAKSQAAMSLLGGLTTKLGRHGLDAQTIDQNALEIVEQVQAVFAKFEERLAEKNRDSEIKDAESDFKKWQKVAEDK